MYRWGRCQRHITAARRSVCLLMAAIVIASTAVAQTPAGTQIRAAAEATYETPNGIAHRVVSDTLILVVAQVAGVDLEAPQTKTGNPGSTILFEHTLTNVGNGTDSVLVAAISRRGWATQVFFVSRESGGFQQPEPLSAGRAVLAMGDTIGVLIAVTIPTWESISGPADTVSVLATSLFDPSVSDGLDNFIAITDPGIVVTLEKQVDRATATIGDILTYTIEYRATGPNSASDFTIRDAIPSGTSYVPGTLFLNGEPVTDAAGDDVGAFETGSAQVVFQIGAIRGGDSGVVSFQVRIES